MLHDLRDAVRMLIRTPWTSAAIVLSLGIGTGANAAVYSALDALVFRAPSGVADPARLVDVFTSQINGGTYGSSSYPDFLSIGAAPSLARAAAFEERDETELRLGARTVLARVTAVSEDFWGVLGATAYLGRWPDPRAAEPDGAVISFDLWSALGADRQVAGATATIAGQPWRIAGVAPPHFHGLHLDRVTDLWVPLDSRLRQEGRGDRRLAIVGRLRPGAGIEQLQASLTGISTELSRRLPETNAGTIRSEDEPRRFTAVPYSRVDPAVRQKARLLAFVLLGGACLLLLSACVNAGSLLVSRGISRRVELAVRMALGAHRARLVRALVAEGLILALSGAIAGVGAAAWTAGAIPALFAPEQARLLDTRVDPVVMLVAMLVGLAAGVVLGLVPALASTRSLEAEVVRGDPGGVGECRTGARLRMALVGAQLAFSMIFIIESILVGSVIDSALRIDSAPMGRPIVFAWVETYDPNYREAAFPRIRHLPSVEMAGWVGRPPLTRAARREFRIERGSATEAAQFDVNFASAGFFVATYIPVIDGRLFTADDDRTEARVALVNETLAQRYFADRAVGHVLTDATGNAVQIVGVVRTQTYRAFEGSPRPMVYYPMSRATSRGFYAVVRTRYAGVEPELLEALRASGETTALQVSTLDALLSRALAADRLIVTLLWACGLIALGLAGVGAYAVLGDAARRRGREIALRIALGAGPLQIVRVVFGGALAPVLAGLVAGALGAELLVRVARSQVYGLPSLNAALIVRVAAGLLLVVGAAVIPAARRALRVSPAIALREHPESSV
jgi:predicted permease